MNFVVVDIKIEKIVSFQKLLVIWVRKICKIYSLVTYFYMLTSFSKKIFRRFSKRNKAGNKITMCMHLC